MNSKEIFSVSDIVFARLVQGNREIASLKLTGVGSIAQLIDYVRRTLSGLKGRIEIRIRNFDQGWSTVRSLLLMPSAAVQGL